MRRGVRISVLALAGLAMLAASILAHAALSAHASSAMPTTGARGEGNQKQIVGYFTSWSIYNGYYVKNIATSGAAGKLTVVSYAFANITSDYKCAIGDSWADYQKAFTDPSQTVNGVADTWTQPLAGNFNQLKELKAAYPNLKVIIAIGGWTWSSHFAGAASAANRSAFVSSCIDMFIKGNLPGAPAGAAAGVFDGIDVDWEYPDNPGNGNPYGPQDIPNYTGLMAEFRTQLDAAGAATHTHYLLTTDTSSGQDKYGVLQLPQVAAHVDWLNLLTYDMHGPWNPTGPTDFNAPLFASPQDPSPPPANQYSVNRAVTDYLAAGVPAHKIVIGVPFYGHGWTNVPNVNHGLYQSAPSMTPAAGGGTLDYNVLESLPGYTRYFDPLTQSSWIFDGATFWSFDDPATMKSKMLYVRGLGLGGAMFWSLDGDDASGTAVSALYNGLHG